MKTFSAELAHLRDMLSYIHQEVKKKGFDSSFVNKVELASEEVLVNIIHYGYPNRIPGLIEIDCQMPSPKTIKIVIRDKGVPYNPLDYPVDVNPEEGLEERTIGGYGIFIISKLMDEVAYARDQEENVLTMVKHEKVS
jgi:serine/threonine-protein kinase RsbW